MYTIIITKEKSEVVYSNSFPEKEETLQVNIKEWYPGWLVKLCIRLAIWKDKRANKK